MCFHVYIPTSGLSYLFCKRVTGTYTFNNDPGSIRTVAIAKDCSGIEEVVDARKYDGSSGGRSPRIGQVVVLQNKNGYWTAIKVLGIKDDTRSGDHDEVTFDYVIQTNGSPGFIL